MMNQKRTLRSSRQMSLKMLLKKIQLTSQKQAIDILLRVNAEESHGTAPLDWDITVCSLPPLSEVGILGRGHIGRLRAVPTSRYSYPQTTVRKTRSYFLCRR